MASEEYRERRTHAPDSVPTMMSDSRTALNLAYRRLGSTVCRRVGGSLALRVNALDVVDVFSAHPALGSVVVLIHIYFEVCL